MILCCGCVVQKDGSEWGIAQACTYHSPAAPAPAAEPPQDVELDTRIKDALRPLIIYEATRGDTTRKVLADDALKLQATLRAAAAALAAMARERDARVFNEPTLAQIARVQTQRAEQAEAALAEAREDADYYKWRMTEIIPLFEEARDAICAIPLASAKIKGLDLSLGDRMDRAGTRTRADFDAARGKGGRPTA